MRSILASCIAIVSTNASGITNEDSGEIVPPSVTLGPSDISTTEETSDEATMEIFPIVYDSPAVSPPTADSRAPCNPSDNMYNNSITKYINCVHLGDMPNLPEGVQFSSNTTMENDSDHTRNSFEQNIGGWIVGDDNKNFESTEDVIHEDSEIFNTTPSGEIVSPPIIL